MHSACHACGVIAARLTRCFKSPASAKVRTLKRVASTAAHSSCTVKPAALIETRSRRLIAAHVARQNAKPSIAALFALRRKFLEATSGFRQHIRLYISDISLQAPTLPFASPRVCLVVRINLAGRHASDLPVEMKDISCRRGAGRSTRETLPDRCLQKKCISLHPEE